MALACGDQGQSVDESPACSRHSVWRGERGGGRGAPGSGESGSMEHLHCRRLCVSRQCDSAPIHRLQPASEAIQ